MKKLELAYNRKYFWENYWREHGVDHEHFRDLEMYPIRMTLRHVQPGHRILECGFGAGRVVRHLVHAGYDTIGLEYNQKISHELRRKDRRLRIVCGDVRSLPFPDNCFDVALAFGVVGTMNERMAASISELVRVIRPGGTLVLSVMIDNLARKTQKWINRLSTRGRPEFYAWMDTEAGWSTYFERFGLRTIETEPMVSRYNVFYWAPLLRARTPSDLTLARVDDTAYRLNVAGRLVWELHHRWFRYGMAAAITFSLAKDKGVISR